MDNSKRPHAFNAPGGFYVVDGCCTACDVPRERAPELFTYDADDHCYVKRQPATATELNKAMRVMWEQELQCVRYCGSDAGTIRRIAEMGNAELCDSSIPNSIEPVFRNHTTLECPTRSDISPEQLAIEFKQSLIDVAGESPKHTFQPITVSANYAALTFAWHKDHFYTVNFSAVEERSTWHVGQSPTEFTGSRGVSMMIHDWIAGDAQFTNIRWYSGSEWSKSTGWQSTPF